MDRINDIRKAVKDNYNNFGKRVECIMISEDMANSMYLEFVELYAPNTSPILDSKIRLRELNAFMEAVGLPSVVIIN